MTEYVLCISIHGATYSIYIMIPMLHISHHWLYPRPLIISGAEMGTHRNVGLRFQWAKILI